MVVTWVERGWPVMHPQSREVETRISRDLLVFIMFMYSEDELEMEES